MFDKFGEFDSYEEINRAAAAEKQENDSDALLLLAEENGIDEDDVYDYLDGITKELTSPMLAAIGKLEIETNEYKLEGILRDWVAELIDMCVSDENFAIGVRKKGKNLRDLIALWIDSGYRNKIKVDTRITDKTEEVKKILGNHELIIGEPNRRDRKVIAIKYYTGGSK